MEMLPLLLVIVLLILLLVLQSRIREIDRKTDLLRLDLREAIHEIRGLRFTASSPVESLTAPPRAEKTAEEIPWAEVAERKPAPIESTEETLTESRPAQVSPVLPQAISSEPKITPPARGATPPPLPKRISAVAPKPAPVAAATEPSRFESSVRDILSKIWNWIVVGEEHRPKGVTMEFAVATTWLIRVGVLIFLIGVGFFLKYSITKGWIGPMMRVALATATGAGLVAWGTRLFPGRYRVLGQGLAGAGFATLYFSFFTAHQPGYDIVGPTVAFVLMTLVTLTAALVAIRYHTLLVAVLGLIGGYGTPLLIRTGTESVVLLFGYLLLLGLGMFAVAAKKEWRLLHYLGFGATVVLVGMTCDRSFTPERFWQFMPFLLAFFALFSSTAFVHQWIHRKPSTVLELIFLFLNAAAFTGISVACIEQTYRREAIAVLTLGLAIFYLLHITVFMKRGVRDRGLLYSFTGLAAFFVTITLPLVLSKGWITVSWSLQAFVMLWIASRMRSEFLRQLAYVLYLVVIARFAIFDLEDQFGGLSTNLTTKEYLLHLMERILVLGIPIGSFFAAGRLFIGEAESTAIQKDEMLPWFGQSALSRVCFWIVVVLTFVALNLEVHHSFGTFYQPLVRPGITLVWIALGALLLREMMTGRSPFATILFWVLSAALVLKVFLFDLTSFDPGFDLAFAPRDFVPGLLMRALDFGAVAVFFLLVAQVLKGRAGFDDTARVFGYASLGAFFLYTSLEFWTGLSRFLPEFRMGGISIYWSVFAVALLLVGILRSRTALRALGLILLGGTILKVFFVDLAGLDQLYRIIAFIGLGVLVLSGSFFYFKFSHRFITTSSDDGEDGSNSQPDPTES